MAWIKMPPVFVAALFALAFASRADAASLTIAWDPPSDGATAGYTVFYGTAPGVYTSLLNVGFVTQRQIDGLANSTTYYFTVRAYNSSGQLSDFSAMVAGTTPTTTDSGGSPNGKGGGGGKTKPSKGKPAANVIDDQYIEIAWQSEAADLAPGAAAASTVGYRVEVGTAFGETSYSALTTASSLAFDMTDLPAEQYFVRVRPVISTAGSLTFGHVSEDVPIAPQRPLPPSAPVNPSDNPGQCVAAPKAPRQLSATAEGAAVALNWKRGPGNAPASYVLQVGSSPGLQDVLITEFPGHVTGVSAMAGNAAYALRLSAVNNCGTSVWAPEGMLYVGVDPLPGMVQGLTQQVNGGLVTLTWQPPAKGGPITRYLIEATTAFGPIAYDTGTTVTGFSNANTPPGQYLVTVRAGNATGFGVASAPVVVTVP